MNVLVVLNTRSGSIKKKERREALLSALRNAGYNATVVSVKNRSEISSLIPPHLKNGCPVVIAARGDGTLSAVAALLIGTNVSLGMIPGGTLNHFAKELSIPTDFVEAVQVIRAGITKQVDVATVNGVPFLNNSSLGVYPNMVLKREEIRKRGIRKTLALLLASASTLAMLPLLRVRLELNGQMTDHIATPFVFVGNNPYDFEGLNFGTRPRIDTGQLCICVVRNTSRLALVRTFIQTVFRGFRGASDLDVFFTARASVETRAPVLPVSLDGEVARLRTPLLYAIRPRALNVIVPAAEGEHPR